MIPSWQPCPLPCLFSSCVSPPVCSVCHLAAACGRETTPTCSSQVNPLCNQLPSKPLDSFLHVARLFHHYTVRGCSHLGSPVNFVAILLWLACVANTSVPLLLCLRLPYGLCSLVFATALPACGFCLQAVCSPVFPCQVSTLEKMDPTTPRCTTTSAPSSLLVILQDPGTSHHPLLFSVVSHCWTLKVLLFTVIRGLSRAFGSELIQITTGSLYNAVVMCAADLLCL